MKAEKHYMIMSECTSTFIEDSQFQCILSFTKNVNDPRVTKQHHLKKRTKSVEEKYFGLLTAEELTKCYRGICYLIQ